MLQKTVIVEGNIGAGKSTFLRLLDEALPVHLVYEPSARWQDIQGENLLDYFYKDPHRWAYSFQTFAFVTRILELEQESKRTESPVVVLERSIYSDRYCFAKNAFELGFMTGLEWKLYQEWFTWLEQAYAKKPDAFIYLQTDPTVCYNRMQKRNRSEEAAVPLDYLSRMHAKHEQWLINRVDVHPSLHHIPTLVLDCNNDFEEHPALFQEHVNKIVAFFGQIFNLRAQELYTKNYCEKVSI